MIFTVVYRDKAGQRATLELDVPDRSAVWTELKKRGISALSVREGTDKAHKPSSKRPALVRGILAGVCVVALALGAWWWMASREGTPPPTEKPAKPKAVKPQPPSRTYKPSAPVAQPQPKPWHRRHRRRRLTSVTMVGAQLAVRRTVLPQTGPVSVVMNSCGVEHSSSMV